MKKISNQIGLICLSLLFVLSCKTPQTTTTTAKKQETQVVVAVTEKAKEDIAEVTKIPFDPDTRTGVLSNGLTYYIKKNSKPENYAELRLALNAGALQETDAQQGLAHFVEHMCFNGTEKFPKNQLVDYLEGIGTKFGAHLNAYTSFDETVYMLRIPTDDAEKFNTGMNILEQWAHKVSFEGEEIEKERGVVISEWRTRLGASDRIMQKTLPKTFYKSRYAERLPIGKKDILETFPHEELRNFYKDWYRPDLMAIVAVGDFDMDQVEEMIKDKFGKIAPVENPKPRESYEIPDHKETLIAIESDDESTYNMIRLQYKHDKRPMNTLEDYRKSIISNLGSSMIDARLDELMQQSDAPFTYASSGYRGMARTKDSYGSFAVVPEGGFLKGLKALLTENERAVRFGFTQTELDRIKKATIAGLEKQFREKDKTDSRSLVMSYVYHFLSESPVPGIAQQLELYTGILPSITLEEVNATFKGFIRPDNQVIILSGIEKEGNEMPQESEVRSILNEISGMELKPYEDNVSTAPLMAQVPAPGKIDVEKTIEELGVTELTFQNGVRVILKPTTFKNDQIMMQSYSPGGTSLYSDEDYMSAVMSDQVISESGLGEFDNVQLEKYLSDKVVNVSPFIAELSEGINGTCSPKDIETFFQMVNLYFTQPRKDPNAFATVIAQNKGFFGNFLSNPAMYFRSEVNKVMTGNHFRRDVVPSPEKMDQAKLDKAYEIYTDRFSDASDFTFLFVGNFDVETLKPMLATYLGSLPSKAREENWKDIGVVRPDGVIEKAFYKGREPQSQVNLKFTGDAEWNTKTRYELSSSVAVLRIMLRESMREDKGGVYGVGASASLQKEPKEQYSININFTCAPENVEELISTALKDIETLRKEGASEKNIQKVKEAQRTDIMQGIKENRYWMRQLSFSYKNDLDPKRILELDKPLEHLTSEVVQKTINQFFDMKNYARFVLYPETEMQKEEN